MKKLKQLAQALVICVIAGVVGCANGGKSAVTVSIPLDPQQTSIANLKGQVKVSGMSGTFVMTIGATAASVTIEDVPEGSRTFSITFFVGQPSDPIVVAVVQVTRNVGGEGNLDITYGAADFSYEFDDDDDGFTNYDELSYAADPRDADDYPTAVLYADAGIDLNVSLGVGVFMDGSNSRICLGSGASESCIYLVDYPSTTDVTITWEWSFVSTPSGSSAYLQDANTSEASFTPDVEGVYSVKLTVQYCVDTSCLFSDDTAAITAAAAGGTGTPAAPTNLTGVSAAGPAVNLTWKDNSTNETGFGLQWSMDGSTWYALTTVGANVVQYTDTVVVAGSTYSYRAYAYNANGNSIYSNIVQVTVTAAASGWTAGWLGAGGYHTCAVTAAGGVKCWGRNSSGQLGNGSSSGPQTCNNGETDEGCGTTAVDVSSLTSGIAKVTGGGYHTCSLSTGTSGGVKCWGFNSWGELGNSSYTDSLTPVNVTGLTSGVTDITAGLYHTCALLSGGTVRCWGDDTYGQLGNGVTDTTYNASQLVSSLTGVTAISAGWYHTCAIVSGGTIKCWGRNNYGQLGNGTVVDSSVPVSVSNIASGATSIAAGNLGTFTCAVVSGGVKCWGYNYYNQLGVFNSSGPEFCGSSACSKIPVNVTNLTSGVTEVSAGGYHACALSTTGGIKCWGRGEFGALGNGSTTDIYTPADVTGLTSGVSQISMGGFFSCARLSTGSLKCWGHNIFGQIGDGTSGTAAQKNSPADVDMIP